MVPIVFDYEAISVWGVSGLPSGLKGDIDEDEHAIIIAGTVGETVMSGDYDYKVTVKDKNSKEYSLSGTITVEGLPNVAAIRVVENEKQKVTAGEAIKPIVFKFANVSVSENMDNFKFEQTLPGSLKISVKDDILTINGNVAENAKDGAYSIKVIAKGEKNNDTAFATVEVTHKSVVTSLSVIENGTQTAIAGDSIEPIVFKFENIVDYEKPTGFPGSYEVVPDNATKTLTVIGLLSENAKGPYTITLTVIGADNNASAEATINVVQASSSSSVASSSSSSVESSSSEKTTKIVSATMNGVKLGYANNMLTIAQPTSSMVRVQVFDLTGHLVESLEEPVMGSRSFSIAHLNRGNYLVRVESNSQMRTAKVSVK
jgi:hypothetical protein